MGVEQLKEIIGGDYEALDLACLRIGYSLAGSYANITVLYRREGLYKRIYQFGKVAIMRVDAFERFYDFQNMEIHNQIPTQAAMLNVGASVIDLKITPITEASLRDIEDFIAQHE